MSRYILVVVFILLNVPSVEARQRFTQLVKKVTDLEIRYEEGDPPTMKLTVTGIVTSAGHTNFEIRPRWNDVDGPSDGILEFSMTSSPPVSAVSSATEVTATYELPNYAMLFRRFEIKGIRILGEGNGVITRMFGDNLRVRKNIADLTPDEIATFERGVRVMKERASDDPTSWSFQANIHGEDTPEHNRLWNQCRHRSIHFLTWHRAYLLEFENILREACGDQNFTLPYWDWIENPALPLAFRNPNSPLYDDSREPLLNQGMTLLPTFALQMGLADAMSSSTYEEFNQKLELSPHNPVHGNVGGNMNNTLTAAGDPIFWLHHANVDRLWDVWLATQEDPRFPTDMTFLEQGFELPGIRREFTVHYRAQELLDSGQSKYRYADLGGIRSQLATFLPEPPRMMAMTAVMQEDELLASSRPSGNVVGAAVNDPLGMESKRIELIVAEQSQQRLSAVAGAAKSDATERLVVEIVGLSVKQAPDFTYIVYLNLPESVISDEVRKLHYVGTLNTFSLGDHENHGDQDAGQHGHQASDESVQQFDATRTIAKLRDAGLWDETSLSVTLVPLTLVAVDEESQRKLDESLKASAVASEIRYDRVDVKIIRKDNH